MCWAGSLEASSSPVETKKKRLIKVKCKRLGTRNRPRMVKIMQENWKRDRSVTPIHPSTLGRSAGVGQLDSDQQVSWPWDVAATPIEDELVHQSGPVFREAIANGNGYAEDWINCRSRGKSTQGQCCTDLTVSFSWYSAGSIVCCNPTCRLRSVSHYRRCSEREYPW